MHGVYCVVLIGKRTINDDDDDDDITDEGILKQSREFSLAGIAKIACNALISIAEKLIRTIFWIWLKLCYHDDDDDDDDDEVLKLYIDTGSFLNLRLRSVGNILGWRERGRYQTTCLYRLPRYPNLPSCWRNTCFKKRDQEGNKYHLQFGPGFGFVDFSHGSRHQNDDRMS